MKPLRTENLKISFQTLKNRLEVGDIVTVNGRRYEAVLNITQLLNGQPGCIGCAFVAEGEYHTYCGWPPLTSKPFHCGGSKNEVKNQILLKEIP